MNTPFADWLDTVVAAPRQHARWLNTLSYLENCGARKIAACEHPTKVRSEMLKHAAEEFRHAYHLKRQIPKTGIAASEDYALPSLIGGCRALRYLDKVDVAICRALQSSYGVTGSELQASAYHLVTYAIEVRASQLYPLYQDILSSHNSPISMRSIILEEENHLAEITAELEKYPGCQAMQQQAEDIEKRLFQQLIPHLYADEVINLS